ncbi:hypothetical protein AGMMS49991_11150 [Spirochaetia bacterium]|nr:hypothetical protein AGMMS49991_11150 [Spirochaetia bacterium]
MEAIAFQSEIKDGVIVIPEQYKGVFLSPVLVTIIRDVQHEIAPAKSFPSDIEKRQAAFKAFSRFKGTLPADFDYKKELAEYREERYGRAD